MTNSTLCSASSMTLPNCKVTRNMRENLECLMNITIPAMPGFGHMPIFRSGLGPEDDILLLLCLGHMSTQRLVEENQHELFQRSSNPRPRSSVDTLHGADLSNQKAYLQPSFPKVKFPSKVKCGELQRTQSLCQLKGRGYWDS